MSEWLESFSPHWVGSLAAMLTTVCFIPQAVKTLRERDTRGISLGMYSLFTLGVFFWLIYGLLLQSPPMILANAVTFPLSAVILGCKIRWG